jgi:alkanesulfonate monooxygenase SsuD/methylene tetrahydromethanopterin reductase-like flavin-dependent oxidoreductase (luciferase family)
MLDHLCGVRMMLGMGRGLAKMEYAGFGIDMNEARERFDEAAEMIINGLETGYVEGNGKYYKQPRVQIRPAPTRSIRDRMFCVAMSPDSVEVAARLGAAMTTFIQYDMEKHAPAIAKYRELFRKYHNREAPPPIVTDFLYCDHDQKEAEDVANKRIAQYFLSVCKHYEFTGTHFGETKGYHHYDEGARLIREFGLEASAQAYKNAQSWGSPDKILKNYTRWKSLIGDFSLNVVASYAGMPYDQVERSQRLFAKEVMPALRAEMAKPAAAKAA